MVTPKTKDMTKEDLIKKVAELEARETELMASKGETVKTKVLSLIESGFNCIDDIAEKLGTNNKNISSNLTYIRADLKGKGKTIVSQRIGQKTMIAVVKLETLGWATNK